MSFILHNLHVFFRVSLIITETFDCGLLGERIIPSLRHAVSVCADSNGHQVMPCGATVYVTAIQCNEIRNKSRLVN